MPFIFMYPPYRSRIHWICIRANNRCLSVPVIRNLLRKRYTNCSATTPIKSVCVKQEYIVFSLCALGIISPGSNQLSAISAEQTKSNVNALPFAVMTQATIMSCLSSALSGHDFDRNFFKTKARLLVYHAIKLPIKNLRINNSTIDR